MEENYNDDARTYTIEEIKALSILSTFGGLLSMAGSACILFIVTTTKKNRERTYDRILLGFSISDLITSPFLAFSFLLTPKEESAWSVGNDISCTIGGFMAHMTMVCAAYSTALSFYFLMKIRCQTPQKNIQKYFEPPMHLISILYPLSTSIIAASTGMFNPFIIGLGCWFAEYPLGCVGSECERGASAGLVKWVMGAIPMMIMFAAVLINYMLIFQAVRRQNRRNLRYVVEGDDHQMKQAEKLQRETAIQATLYTITYVNTFIWAFLHELYRDVTGDNQFVLTALWILLFRMQGFFNFFVYIRPKYLQWRKTHSEESRLWAIRQCIFSANKSPRQQQQQQKQQQYQPQPPQETDIVSGIISTELQVSNENHITSDSFRSNDLFDHDGDEGKP